jgi:hypothetical protein
MNKVNLQDIMDKQLDYQFAVWPQLPYHQAHSEFDCHSVENLHINNTK